VNQGKGKLGIIPHSRPTLGYEEMKRLTKVFGSAQIAQGKVVREFERAFSKKLGARYAACASSGTAALHITLLAMGIGSKDEVIIPSYVCTALLHAIKYVGATPVMAEIDPATFNIDPHDVRKRLTGRTRAVIVPHLFGLAADLEGLLALGVPIIEDCAQAVGGSYRQKSLGTFGHASIFSFYATKVMTTGEGGMVLSSSKDLIDRIKDLREYDKRDDYKVRFNYKMTDIHAAVGLTQLDRLETFVQRRRGIAKRYDQAFEPLDLPLPPKDPGHIYFRYIIGLKKDSGPWIQSLQKKGVECARPVHFPLHRYFSLKGYTRTEKAWEHNLSIPIYPSLSNEDADRVIDLFIKTFREKTRDGKN
jgi:dTDP-4-amino-4,6-dideoxygalactose transaminase